MIESLPETLDFTAKLGDFVENSSGNLFPTDLVKDLDTHVIPSWVIVSIGF